LTDVNERLNIFKNYLLDKIKSKPNTKYIEVVEQLYQTPKEQTVVTIAESFNCNKRHLYRIFKMNYGLSPKVLLNILRLHLCLTLMIENDIDFIEVANICGFYDQAHFIKEIKKYTGFSPLRLLDNYK
ncbi:helix-turn-helix domain-containing protein, partial [Thomasclavelia cocleata]